MGILSLAAKVVTAPVRLVAAPIRTLEKAILPTPFLTNGVKTVLDSLEQSAAEMEEEASEDGNSTN